MTIVVVMIRRQAYAIAYTLQMQDHLRAIDRKHHSSIRSSIEEQLAFEPFTETKNRKPLQRPVDFEATWELRCGPKNSFRVFYSVDTEGHAVTVVAIGVKEGSRLLIADKEIKL
jgi:mRNA-degrading endonuclease RelE of RelBE toxin-antitoxin system